MSVPSHPVASLKAALRAHLLADADVAALIGTAVFEVPPRGAAPPYLVLGDALSRERDSVGGEGVELEFDLMAVTSERGSAAALTLVAAVGQALQSPLPALDGHHLVSIETRQLATRHEAATSLTRAMLRLRAFTEPL